MVNKTMKIGARDAGRAHQSAPRLVSDYAARVGVSGELLSRVRSDVIGAWLSQRRAVWRHVCLSLPVIFGAAWR